MLGEGGGSYESVLRRERQDKAAREAEEEKAVEETRAVGVLTVGGAAVGFKAGLFFDFLTVASHAPLPMATPRLAIAGAVLGTLGTIGLQLEHQYDEWRKKQSSPK